MCFIRVPKVNRSKFDPKALKCVFLGYATNQKGYKCYDPASRKLFVSHDVTFFESISFFFPSQSHSPREVLVVVPWPMCHLVLFLLIYLTMVAILVIRVPQVKMTMVLRGRVMQIISKSKIKLHLRGSKEVVHQKSYKSLHEKNEQSQLLM